MYKGKIVFVETVLADPHNARNIFESEMYFLSSHDTLLVKLFLIAICAIAAVLESADLIKPIYSWAENSTTIVHLN